MSLVGAFTPTGNTVLLTANSAAPLGVFPLISTGSGSTQFHIVNSGTQTAYLTYAGDPTTAQSLASAYVPSFVSTPSFFAPLTSGLALTSGVGSATFTRATTATCFGYKETDGPSASQSLLTIPAGIPRFSGARFLASNNTWSALFADGTPIPSAQLLGYLSEGAATNFFLNSGAPATQTTGSLGTGTYTCWLTGTGSIAISAGTATITGAGTATAGSPVTFTVTVAGTVVCTVAGTPTTAQVENTAFPTSYISTTGAPVSRNVDILSYPSSGNLLTLSDYSLYAEFRLNGVVAGNQIAIGSGSLYRPFLDVGRGLPQTISFWTDTNGAVNADATMPAATKLTQVNKVATRKDSVNHIAAANGAIGTQTAIGTQGAEIALVCIGCASVAVQLQGNIRNVRIWQSALDNSILQYITGTNIPAGIAIPILPGSTAVYSAPLGSYFSAITALPGATNLYITPGEGM